jgi:hypothetical protein
MHKLVVALSILLLASGPLVAQRAERERVRHLAGCWATAVSTFTSASTTPMTDTGLTNVPPQVRLDTVPGRGWRGEPRQWLLRAIPGRSGTRYRDGYFAVVGSDSVIMVWSNGYIGLSALGRAIGDTIYGVATAATDYGAQMKASIVLRRVACR